MTTSNHSAPTLARLLVNSQGEEPERWFDQLADWLIRHCELVITSGKFCWPMGIAEVEFYFHSQEHPDPFVHCNAQQLTCGQWYFHRESSAKIGFTLKGLDLTFGRQGNSPQHGGILIRAIVSNAELIEGPSLVLDHILDICGVTSVAGREGLKGLTGYSDDAFSETGLLHLREWLEPMMSMSEPLVVRAGPRVGLKKEQDYKEACYRYRAYCDKTTRDKKRIMAGRKVPEMVISSGLAESDLPPVES